MRLVELPTPPAAVGRLKAGSCDLAFLGIEPSRAAQIDFTPPVIQFDYTLLVPAGSAIRHAAEADRPGVRIAIVRDHASSLALRRLVKHAALSAAELPDTAFDMLRSGNADALAAPREQLLDYAAKLPGARVLADSYGINRVAVVVRKGRAGWLAYVGKFIEAAKVSGMIAQIIARGRLHDFQVAS
jgi:polar amino acid transport system substrate-binding protein